MVYITVSLHTCYKFIIWDDAQAARTVHNSSHTRLPWKIIYFSYLVRIYKKYLISKGHVFRIFLQDNVGNNPSCNWAYVDCLLGHFTKYKIARKTLFTENIARYVLVWYKISRNIIL